MRIRLLSASCKGAGLWQTVIPSEQSLQMSDTAFRSSMKLLLGIVTDEALLNGSCICGAQMNDCNSAHFHSCRKLADAVRKRHDSVKNTLALFVKECSSSSPTSIFIEPKSKLFVDPNNVNSRERADLVLVNRSMSVMVDVTVTNPTGSTHREISNGRIYDQPLVSVERVVSEKWDRHYGRASAMGLKLCIPALEIYGAMNPATVMLIRNVARSAEFNASVKEVKDIVYKGMSLISIALQNGNSIVAEQGMVLAKYNSFYSYNNNLSYSNHYHHDRLTHSFGSHSLIPVVPVC